MVTLSQRSLFFRRGGLLQNVTYLCRQRALRVSTSYFSSNSLSTVGCHCARVICSLPNDFQVVQRTSKSLLPSELRLPVQSKLETDGVEDGENGKFQSNEIPLGTVSEVFNAATKTVGDAPVKTVGEVALFGGMAAMGLAVSGSLLSSVEAFPLLPEALQTIGVAFSIVMASQIVRGKSVAFPPPSPVKAVIELVDSGNARVENISIKLPEDLEGGVALAMQKLAEERDLAVNQMENMKRSATNYASVLAEKEALEAVALQLADERENALSEVVGLKTAVTTMASRMKVIEDILEQEVEQLKQQNQALERVSLQLAAERNGAINEVARLELLLTESMSKKADEKIALEVAASQLVQERDKALAEIENLKKVIITLKETSKESQLSVEQEQFIKLRVQALRTQFINMERGYEEQKDQVDRFVGHLVEEYGAPYDWTREYMRRILDSSARAER